MVVLRWVSAVAAGVVAYWVGLLLTLGVLAMALQKVATPTDVGHSTTLLSISLFAGSFAGCIVAIALAPRSSWRTMAVVALAVAAAWAIYGQVSAGHDLVAAVVESAAAIVGALAAWGLAARTFGRKK
jgi:hypothetical protein